MRSRRSNKPWTISPQSLFDLLEDRVRLYNQVSFIETDPICIPHQYFRLQDIEITGFWTAMLSWGQRTTIIAKAKDLFARMGASPHEFILNHTARERRRFEDFRHRTFQPTDTIYFLTFLQEYYRIHDSLETAFSRHIDQAVPSMHNALAGFHELFFSPPWAPLRTRKHVSTPLRGASCKRLNMFLRWMVRRDDCGVDFGLWRRLDPAWLMI
ncbi:MAG: DUF2400 domain-containing protein, partial [Saprospiraceae bacterium]|nr:DUF2400 domain-containing protein [Saprospiraceae bacterium]